MKNMTVTTNPNRQKPGQPSGGQFADRDRVESDVTLLGARYPHINTPTQDQRRRAQEVAARESAWAGAIGAAAQRTAGTIAADLADQEGAYEAFKLGQGHPDDPAFDMVWDGESGGCSREYVEQELARTRAERAALAIGDLPMSLEASGGYSGTPHERAAQYLDEKIDLYAEAIRSSGKNLSVNQAAVLRARRTRERAEAPL